eukprot:430259-Pyramimonas_sp.AAC.1
MALGACYHAHCACDRAGKLTELATEVDTLGAATLVGRLDTQAPVRVPAWAGGAAGPSVPA